MAEASSCAGRWGMCMHDARCADVHCPGRPITDQERDCSVCLGACPTPQACLRPLAELPVRIERRLFTNRRVALRLPSTREGWGHLVMRAIGSAGFFFIFGAIGRSKGWF